MNKRQLLKILNENGFRQLPKKGKGSHEVWSNGTNLITIPKPSGSDYPTGTIKAILKQAGLK